MSRTNKDNIYNCRVCGNKTGRNDGHDRLCFGCHLKVFEDNFNSLNPYGIFLMYEKFNEISEIKSKKYVTFFKRNFENIKTWYDILKYFDKQENAIKYICDEFIRFSIEHKNENIHDFILNHETSVNTLCLNIGFKEIKSRCGMKVVNANYTREFMCNEYIRIKSLIGDIPNYNEFFDNTIMSNGVINMKYNGYENFVKTEFPDDIDRYYLKRKDMKSKIAQLHLTGRYQLSNDELIDKYRLCIENYITTYKEFPSSKVLCNIYDLDFKNFKVRTGMGFPSLMEYLGYNITKLKSFNRSEKSCLNSISNILNCEYTPQKKFDWLIGCKGSQLFCDGYFEDYNLVVEFNGVQHYKPIERFGGEESFKILQQNDELKKKLCEEHGIKFLIIKSCQPWYKEDWLRKKLIQEGIITNA